MGYGDKKTEGGHAAAYPDYEVLPIHAAPSHGKEKTTLREELLPVGCWKLEDLRFIFDSSMVLPEAKPEFEELATLKSALPGSPLTIFGHADPVGDDVYNKVLSGRRARAVYAVITRNTDIWESLYTNSEGTGDDWKLNHLQIMLRALGFDPGNTSGSVTAQSTNAVKDFQRSKDLDDDGDPGKDTRKELFKAYMDFLCPVTLAKTDFLGRGEDAGGKADYQGCSEFNPQMMFSAEENTRFSNAADKTERNAENSINRRVMALLFRPGIKIDTNRWPCPRASEGTAGCVKRLWFDAPTRRQFQAKRRTNIVDRDTFACRFYDRMVGTSPCEGPVVPIDDRKLRVFLKLMYLDPEGKPQPFPKDVPVTVVNPAGDQNEKTLNDGLLIFDFDRAKGFFTLGFSHPDHYIALATAATTGADKNRWLAATDVAAAAKDFYNAFKTPKEWSLTTSDWIKVDSPLYNVAEFRFENLTPKSAELGVDGTPVEMHLDPHWQFIRLEFFDRGFGHATHAGKRIGTPPILLEGFRDGSATRGPVPNPDTRSNWTINLSDPATQTQALPWIIQRRADKSADARPTAKVLLQFIQPANTFIVSKDGNTRTVEPVADAAKRAPGPDRMKLYDLPELWKSNKYFTRGAATNKFYDQLTDADVLTSLDKTKPLAFSLDDIILVDAAGAPSPAGGDDLALIFFHQFKKPAAGNADIKDQGVWKLGADASKTFFPYSGVKMPVKHYVHDYADWTRLVIVNGNPYEAFAGRTPDTGAHDVIGARAANMWVDSVAAGQVPTNPVNPRPNTTTQPFYSIQPFCFQEIHRVRSRCMPAGTSNENTAMVPSFAGHVRGRYDSLLLRCCDLDGADELAYNVNYFRFHFDFTTPPATNADGSAFNNNNYKKAMLENVPKRWNGPETLALTDGSALVTNPGDFFFKPQTAAALAFKCKPFFYCQETPQPRAHFRLNVLDSAVQARADMSGFNGVGNFNQGNETHNPANGFFTAAHETGHGYGLPDEYNERWGGGACSYQFPGFGSGIPGDPFSIRSGALMMEGINTVENRYFWHSAEWVRRILGTPLQVESGAFKYFVPPHPTAVNNSRAFEYFPLFINSRGTGGAFGVFDTYLHTLGKDSYANRLKPGVEYDGLLCVVVKIGYQFPAAAAHTDIVDPIRDFNNTIDSNMNRKFVFRGALAPANYTNCLVHFMPRSLVETFVSDGTAANTRYIAGLGFTAAAPANQANYTTKVNAVDADHPRHFTIRVVTATPPGWKNANTLHLTPALLRAADAWKWFADMAAIDCSSLANPATGLTNARVESRIVHPSVPGAVVSASA
ncbi:MAG: peptidoglycan-binding protein [Bryobacteraceae bacterium]